MSAKKHIYLDSDIHEIPAEHQKNVSAALRDASDALKEVQMICGDAGVLEGLNDLNLSGDQGCKAKDLASRAHNTRVQVNSFKNCRNFQISQNHILYRNYSNPCPSRKSPASKGGKDPIIQQLSSEDVTKLEYLKACQQEVSLDDLTNIKGYIGPKKWKSLGRALGFHDAKLDYLKSDHSHDGMEEVVYQMLVDARQQREQLTYSRLTEALVKCDLTDAALVLYSTPER